MFKIPAIGRLVGDVLSVRTLCDGLMRASRRLCRAILVLAITIGTGCAASGPLKDPLFSPRGSSEDQAIRKRVEADPFPSAKQAGMQSVAPQAGFAQRG